MSALPSSASSNPDAGADMHKTAGLTAAGTEQPTRVALPKVARKWWPLNTPQLDWQGRRVWLVGASTGIGLACAQALRQAGAEVVVSARHAQGVRAWAAQDAGVQWRTLDVADAGQVHAVARDLLAEGPLDWVVYAAGYYKAQRATDLNLDDLLQHDQVNYQGALQVIDAVLPSMLARQSGHISLLSSVAGWRGLPNGLAYGPTKAALTHLAEIERIFCHMYVALDQPHFVITRQLVDGDQAFLTWEFRFRFKRFDTSTWQTVRGGSHVVFNDQGLVNLHRDYWDAAEELYEKLPLLGGVMRWLKQRANT